MKFLAILLILIVALSSCIFTTLAETEGKTTPATTRSQQCEDCKNALRTVDSKLPGKRTRQQIENYLTGACQQATSLLPIPQLPISLPVPVCSLLTAHHSELVQGLIERKEYTAVCKSANLC